MTNDKKCVDTNSNCDEMTSSNAPLSAPLASKLTTLQEEKISTKRSNSFIENKYKVVIGSERLAQLRKLVETAIRDHKVFTIRGGRWPIIRRELKKRNWLEKFESTDKKMQYEDLLSNLPTKQDWETPNAYVEKCENLVISRMLNKFEPDFYWSMRKEAVDLKHRSSANKLINRFSRSLFASKEGLALLLLQSYWFIEPGVSDINFPRCYVLGFPDHYSLFVDDFRMTACISLLKHYIGEFESKKALENSDNKDSITFQVIHFAMDRCESYIASQKHKDIDSEAPHIWDHEWDQFLENFNQIVHHNRPLQKSDTETVDVYAKAKTILREIVKFWPEYDIDGMKNIWIIKPGNKCRGRGIHLIKSLTDVQKIMDNKLKYIVQKYIERPLIIYDTKFDIRQWFMVTCVQPLTIWMYKDSYLRFSSQIFNLENFHESLHLTNHAVQCKYANGEQRSSALPKDNMWDCHTFQAYLKQLGCAEKWNEVIFPGMKQSIICSMLASQETMDRRPNTYEIYGADFILSEDFRPWLLEINCSPDLSFSTTVTSKLCPQCMEDIIKVMVDKRRDPKAYTGLFEMIYKQNMPRIPPYLGINLSVRGRKILKNRSKQKQSVEVDEEEKERLNLRFKQREISKYELLKDKQIKQILPKLLAKDMHEGPVIEDLIDELKRTFKDNNESGVDFVPIVEKSASKRKSGQKNKTERTKNKGKLEQNNSKFNKKIK